MSACPVRPRSRRRPHLTFGVYWPRHRRRDLVVAFLGINMGILAVAALLASSAFSAGLGLGLSAAVDHPVALR